jgi:hypothetical protein
MTQRTGRADLPLHGGHVPAWLSSRMAILGAVIGEAIVHHYGRDEFLRRLAHPFWFQSFGAVMGMDWHSSGVTTSVLGALKRGLRPLARELGLHVCGGKGKHSRQTPQELRLIAERVGLNGEVLERSSRLVAKVDSAAVQDGFDLYMHGFIVADDGKWTVVQQGMNGDARQARRYHWHSEGLQSFVEEPHAAIEGPDQGIVINLTDRRAASSRQLQLALVVGGPDPIVRELERIGQTTMPPAQPPLRAMMCGQATSRCADCTARWLRQPHTGQPILRISCSSPGSARAPCNRLPWWLRLFTARPIAFRIRPGSRWPMAAKIGTHFPCLFESTMKPFG